VTADNIQGLETLEVWRKSKNFAVKVYKEILPLLPQEEKWNLNQRIRHSVSRSELTSLAQITLFEKNLLYTRAAAPKILNLWKVNRPITPFTITDFPVAYIFSCDPPRHHSGIN